MTNKNIVYIDRLFGNFTFSYFVDGHLTIIGRIEKSKDIYYRTRE